MEFGDSALKYEAVYYVKSSDYNIYMDVQEAINLEIMQKFQDEGIEFAYPTRTVFLQNGERIDGEENERKEQRRTARGGTS
jgi:small-conductance mechanosensitive channel